MQNYSFRLYPNPFSILPEAIPSSWQDPESGRGVAGVESVGGEGDAWAIILPLVEIYVLAIYDASRTPTPLAHVIQSPFSFTGVATTCWEGSI